MSTISPLTSATRPTAPQTPDDPAEAARQFESVLVRQFVEVMTKDLFQSEEGGMLTGQADLQRDTLTDTLSEHLVESGTFGVADLLLAQWERAGRVPAEDRAAADPAPLATPVRQPVTADDVGRFYPTAQEPPRSIDPSEDTP